MQKEQRVRMPAFQFYPADWRSDPGIQSLSFHERGVWFEILCLMHESSDRGKLLLNGKAMPIEALGRALGILKQDLELVIEKLLDYGVASQDPKTKVIYSRRMVRDEGITQLRRKAGSRGGNPAFQKGKPNPYTVGKDNHKQKDNQLYKQKDNLGITPAVAVAVTKVVDVELQPYIPSGDGTLASPTKSKPERPGRRGSRINGTNPRAMGTNKRTLGTNQRTLGTNPLAVATMERREAEKIEAAKPKSWVYAEEPETEEERLKFIDLMHSDVEALKKKKTGQVHTQKT